MAKYNFSFKEFLLYGLLGPIKIGSTRLEVESIFGLEACEIMGSNSKLASYDKLRLQFYYNLNDVLINFHLREDLIHSELKKGNKKTIGIIEALFFDFELFYFPPSKLFNLILEKNIRLYFAKEFANEFSGFFYVNSNNVKMIFQHDLSKIIEGASLSYIGSDSSSLNQLNDWNAIEIKDNNLIVPPFYNEIELYPNGKLLKV